MSAHGPDSSHGSPGGGCGYNLRTVFLSLLVATFIVLSGWAGYNDLIPSAQRIRDETARILQPVISLSYEKGQQRSRNPQLLRNPIQRQFEQVIKPPSSSLPYHADVTQKSHLGNCSNQAVSLKLDPKGFCTIQSQVIEQSKNSYYIRWSQTKEFHAGKKDVSKLKEAIILNWSGEAYEGFVQRGGPDDHSLFANCAYTNCRLTRDHGQLAKADMVVIHHGGWSGLPIYPKIDWRWQTRVLQTRESEMWFPHPMSTNEDHVFNYSMTYQPQSDVIFDYNLKFYWLTKDHRWNLEEVFSRPRLAFQFVSNCGPQLRRTFARRMATRMAVDVFGQCTRRQDGCQSLGPGARLQASKCAEQHRRKYRFYLSFENSRCPGYITEKLWKIFADGLIPIVMGPARAHYEKVAPPGSFIHFQDFASPEALAEHLVKVSKDLTLFKQYHLWRFTAWQPAVHGDMIHCELCRLANEKPARELKLSSFINRGAHCIP